MKYYAAGLYRITQADGAVSHVIASDLEDAINTFATSHPPHDKEMQASRKSTIKKIEDTGHLVYVSDKCRPKK